MKVLVLGGGGREHALAWALANSPSVSQVLVAPGNAGTAREPGCENVALEANDFAAVADFVRAAAVDLTVVGPEAPLVAGIRDHFDDAGLRCFGPSAAAARLEGSKSFSKDFLQRHGIPTAAYASFDDYQTAAAYVRQQGGPIVVKADGLAAGKGVVVARDEAEALAALDRMLRGDDFGGAGRRVVVEEYLEGEEASFICLCDGRRALPFASSQDHKARDDGDRGPNTGGMGAYSPAPVVTPAVHRRILAEVIEPTLAGMAAEGAPYQGFLYAGLMISPAGDPRVIEFNCRFGDPEAQPVLSRLRSDLGELLDAALRGDLGWRTLDWDPQVALGVVMAAGGYPGAYATGEPIAGLDAAEALDGVKVFHAGTRSDGNRVLTSGGRVLCVVGLGDDVAAARERAYAGVSRIDWRDRYYRRDIGHRALGRG